MDYENNNCNINHLLPPSPKYFKESIENSFEGDTKALFLNKLYQLLFPIPHKVRKIVAVGPKDSGKSTWVLPFLALMKPSEVATITKERQFAASMINVRLSNYLLIIIIDYD